MPDGLYEHDALAWSERQADLLRRLERGERVNAEIDWPNLIEEIADVGLSELHSCESFLSQAMIHLIKLHLRPRGPTRHWTAETIGFLRQARKRFSPSMRQRIDLEDEYRFVRRQIALLLPDPGEPLPAGCPWTLEALLAPEPDIAGLIANLANP